MTRKRTRTSCRSCGRNTISWEVAWASKPPRSRGSYLSPSLTYLCQKGKKKKVCPFVDLRLLTHSYCRVLPIYLFILSVLFILLWWVDKMVILGHPWSLYRTNYNSCSGNLLRIAVWYSRWAGKRGIYLKKEKELLYNYCLGFDWATTAVWLSGMVSAKW